MMRKRVPDRLESARVREGHYASNASYGLMGAFLLFGPCGTRLKILSSGPDDNTGWEHVSVSTEHRPPNWQEMCFVKDVFWEDEECVMQLHPPRSQYVNCHEYCLHLWRPIDGKIPMPGSILVGPKGEANARPVRHEEHAREGVRGCEHDATDDEGAGTG